MFNAEITEPEIEILRQLLEHSLVTLELEIRHTDHQEFKSLLKQRRQTVRALLAKLPQPMTMAA
jgi:D-ribose pyranose/furanose isomerase RbsD